MSQNRKWLLLPPAAAVLLVLGSLSMQPKAKAEAPSAPQPVVDARAETQPERPQDSLLTLQTASATDAVTKKPTLPTAPDPFQIISTLVGLLLLGGTGLFLLRRLRQGPRGNSTGIVALRQSVRLSPKHSLHAVEFEGRLLLVGEGERGVQLVHSGDGLQASADEATIAARSHATTQDATALEPHDDSDGAVPRNLVIPRPDHVAQPPSHRPRQARQSAPESEPSAFHDFRSLLAKVER